MKSCIVSFIYPMIEPYLEEFVRSLNKQTYKNIDQILIFDKYDKLIPDYNGKIIKAPINLSIVEVRTWIINKLIDKGYDLVIFLDADDTMEENRIENIIKEYLKTNRKYAFYYNDLFLMKNKKDFYQGKLPREINKIEELYDGNCIGMSHTSLNLNLIKYDLKRLNPPKDIIAYDWLLHSYLLLKGYCGKKVDTKTYYRIYDNNIAGTVENTEKKVLIGLEVKKKHYEFFKVFDKEFEKRYDSILNTEEYIKKYGIDSYIKLLNTNGKKLYWWENIKLIEK